MYEKSVPQVNRFPHLKLQPLLDKREVKAIDIPDNNKINDNILIEETQERKKESIPNDIQHYEQKEDTNDIINNTKNSEMIAQNDLKNVFDDKKEKQENIDTNDTINVISETNKLQEEITKDVSHPQINKNNVTIWPSIFENIPLDGWKDILRGPNAEKTIEENKEILIFVATWNLQAQKPPNDETFIHFIHPRKFHIYAIGTEECVHSIAKSLIFPSKKIWEDLISNILGDEYIMLCGHSLQAIHNVVFAHWSIVHLITNIQSSAIATGLGDQLGNKGGVGISFNIGKTSFLFVNCHFDAHQHRVQDRNANFHKINRELVKTNHINIKEEKSSSINHEKKEKPNLDASDVYHRIFWSGDLNYRINGTRKMIDRLLQQNMHSVLFANDQLYREMNEKRVFDRFKEGPLYFKPTYKYDKGTDLYDTSTKQRIPSWTDRILYRCNDVKESIDLLVYKSIDEIKSSDHRPVIAIFKTKFSLNDILDEKNKPAETNQVRSEVCMIQ